MKKYLQLSLMCLLILAAGVFSSCKDDESEGAYSPLLGMSVKMATADSLVKTMVSIDHANRLVTVSMSQDAVDLQHVECTFDLVKGASLYTPSVTNPVMMDLTAGAGVNIATGDKIVCYKIVPEVDYAVKSVKATFGDYSCEAVIYQKTRVIDLNFKNVPDAGAIDLSQVDVNFDISAITKMADNGSPRRTMNLTADTTYVDLINDFSGTNTYKVLCWVSPEYYAITGNDDVAIEKLEDEVDGYAIGIKGAAPSISLGKFSTQSPVLTFEYKTSADSKFKLPLLKLGADDNYSLSLYGYGFPNVSEWTEYSLELGMTCEDGAPGATNMPGVKMDLTAEIEDTIYIRNIRVRQQDDVEILRDKEAFPLVFEDNESTNNMSTTKITGTSSYETYLFVPMQTADPTKYTVNRAKAIGAEHNQIRFWYKADRQFSLELFWRAIGGYSVYIAEKLQPSPDIWVAVHNDLQTKVEAMFKAHSDAGAAANGFRFDPCNFDGTGWPLTIRDIKLTKKYEVEEDAQ